MPRSHPRRRVFDNQVIDPTDWSDTWTPFAELLGALDEHNISSTVSTSADIQDDFDPASFGVFGQTGFVNDDHLAAMYGVSSTAVWTPVYSNLIQGTRQWISIPNTSETFKSGAGRLRIQLRCSFRTGVGVGGGRPVGLKMGLRLNGGMITESVIGGQDVGTEAPNMEQGIGWNRHTQNLEVTVPVSTGTHNIQGVFWLHKPEGVPLSEKSVDQYLYVLNPSIEFRVMVR